MPTPRLVSGDQAPARLAVGTGYDQGRKLAKCM